MLFGFDPLFLCVLALCIDAVVGEMGPLFRTWFPHPVVVIGRGIAALERRGNRSELSNAKRRLTGIVTLLLLAGGTGIVGFGVEILAAQSWLGEGLRLFLAVTLIAQRSLFDHVLAVSRALDRDGLEAGRKAVARIVGRDVSCLDESGVCRAAIESCAENTSDGVIAPLFWLLVAGLPGLLVYKAVNTLDSMIGHKSERYRCFGWASARCDDVLNYVPARLSGLLFCLSAVFLPKASAKAAFVVMVRDARTHRSPNSGWPEAAVAGALGVRLGGPRVYPGETVDAPWMGEEGRYEITRREINRALHLFVLCGLLVLLGIIFAVWSFR